MTLRLILMAAVVAVMPAMALAQPAAAPDREIDVTAQRLSKDSLRAEARDYVRAALNSIGDKQHARWFVPVCARAIGTTPQLGRLFTDRVNAVARFVGVRVAKPGCKPNIALLFTREPLAVMAAINKREQGALERLPEAERVRLKRPDLPVRWWHFTREDAYDGREFELNPSGSPSNIPIDCNCTFNINPKASRIGAQTRLAITGAAVLVDLDRLGTVPLAALADHVAMAAMVKLKLEPEGRPQPSIMGLFEPGAPKADGFTPEDEAFLEAYYASGADTTGFDQRVQMAGRIADTLLAQATAGAGTAAGAVPATPLARPAGPAQP